MNTRLIARPAGIRGKMRQINLTGKRRLIARPAGLRAAVYEKMISGKKALDPRRTCESEGQRFLRQ